MATATKVRTKKVARPPAAEPTSTLPIATAPGNPGAAVNIDPGPVAEPATMPLYQSHKKVRAAKIEATRRDWAEQGVTVEGLGYVSMGEEWMVRHKPEVGGYLVEYAEGYRSFSPSEAFEAGYKAIKG